MKDRIWEIDAVRGLCVILMVIYHLLFDLQFIFGKVIINISTPFFQLAEPFFAGIFIFVSGLCCNFSRNNLKRGVLLFCISTAIFVATFLYNPNEAICFGILHLLSISMIAAHFILKKEKKLNIIYLFVATTIIILRFFTENISIPYDFLIPLGIHSNTFASLDYFPLIPWFGAFLCGMYFGQIIYKNKKTRLPNSFKFPTLCFFGRHALLIYVLHQPIIMGILLLINI